LEHSIAKEKSSSSSSSDSDKKDKKKDLKKTIKDLEEYKSKQETKVVEFTKTIKELQATIDQKDGLIKQLKENESKQV
jgi:septal ring factor EnvC (AmiA/AmiB activator)